MTARDHATHALALISGVRERMQLRAAGCPKGGGHDPQPVTSLDGVLLGAACRKCGQEWMREEGRKCPA